MDALGHIDMRCLKAIVDEIETIDQNEHPEHVLVIDDLEKYMKNK